MGAPLSLPKTRGGQQVEWLGYLIDVKKGLVRISNKKVLFLESWIREVLSRGCAGKGHARGLGVHGFPSGPLEAPTAILGAGVPGGLQTRAWELYGSSFGYQMSLLRFL
jgi:hypothetical protein